jgi:alpha-tubulin suppressor-like RCC1 family protein
VVCWGWNDYGQTDVPSLSNPTQVSLGGDHSCAIDDTGVVCWGYNEYGQTDVPSLSNPTQVSSGGYHTCALDDTGVVCWGEMNMVKPMCRS